MLSTVNKCLLIYSQPTMHGIYVPNPTLHQSGQSVSRRTKLVLCHLIYSSSVYGVSIHFLIASSIARSTGLKKLIYFASIPESVVVSVAWCRAYIHWCSIDPTALATLVCNKVWWTQVILSHRRSVHTTHCVHLSLPFHSVMYVTNCLFFAI